MSVDVDDNEFSHSRRSILTSGIISATAFLPSAVSAIETESATSNTSNSVSSLSGSQYPPITHKVFFDIRISRADGTFYVRDDLPDKPENKVLTFTLTFGLFGTVAPVHVAEFLKYVTVPYDPLDDNPLPSYGRSIFTKFDQSTGLLQGGNIPGLEITSIGGGSAIKYMGRILSSPLWIEKPNSSSPSPKPLSHQLGKGLLTHRTLDLTPEYQITTRPNADLDASHFVFGRLLLEGEEYQSNQDFLDIVQDLPTYSMDRPVRERSN